MTKSASESSGAAEGAPRGAWWCPSCREEVDGSRVTYQERHDACGTAVEWVEDWPSISATLALALAGAAGEQRARAAAEAEATSLRAALQAQKEAAAKVEARERARADAAEAACAKGRAAREKAEAELQAEKEHGDVCSLDWAEKYDAALSRAEAAETWAAEHGRPFPGTLVDGVNDVLGRVRAALGVPKGASVVDAAAAAERSLEEARRGCGFPTLIGKCGERVLCPTCFRALAAPEPGTERGEGGRKPC